MNLHTLWVIALVLAIIVLLIIIAGAVDINIKG